MCRHRVNPLALAAKVSLKHSPEVYVSTILPSDREEARVNFPSRMDCSICLDTFEEGHLALRMECCSSLGHPACVFDSLTKSADPQKQISHAAKCHLCRKTYSSLRLLSRFSKEPTDVPSIFQFQHEEKYEWLDVSDPTDEMESDSWYEFSLRHRNLPKRRLLVPDPMKAWYLHQEPASGLTELEDWPNPQEGFPWCPYAIVSTSAAGCILIHAVDGAVRHQLLMQEGELRWAWEKQIGSWSNVTEIALPPFVRRVMGYVRRELGDS